MENSLEQSKLSKLWVQRDNLGVLSLTEEPVGLSTNIAEPGDFKNHPAQLFVIRSVQDEHGVILAPQDRVKGANLPSHFADDLLRGGDPRRTVLDLLNTLLGEIEQNHISRHTSLPFCRCACRRWRYGSLRTGPSRAARRRFSIGAALCVSIYISSWSRQ